MNRYKFLITGPVGAGKTTAIQTVSNKKAIQTDVMASDAATLRKKMTTIAMDYCSLRLRHTNPHDSEQLIHLYGTPGQERFDFMWDVLSRGVNGVILLLDNSRNSPEKDLEYYLKAFSSVLQEVPLVLGVNHIHLSNEHTPPDYASLLQTLGVQCSISYIDARKKSDILTLINTLIEQNDQNKVALSNPYSLKKQEQHCKTELKNNTINQATLNKLSNINGVTNITLTNSSGEIIHANENDAMQHISLYLQSALPQIEESLDRGKIEQFWLLSPSEDNLSYFMESQQTLGIQSQNTASITHLKSQIEDVLQWR